MIIVTGAAGFIGSNLIKALNERGITDIIAVDNLTNGQKIKNLADLKIKAYVDKEDFITNLTDNAEGWLQGVTMVFHQGACSDTQIWNGKYIMENNYDYTGRLLTICEVHDIPVIYASSASVYGTSNKFTEDGEYIPLNPYAYSKHLIDNTIDFRILGGTQLVGLRYFNVYGPREQHKGSMVSPIYKFNESALNTGTIEVFSDDGRGADADNFARDFVHVDDIVKVNLWFMDNPQHSGIFNVGTGNSTSFFDVAKNVIEWRYKHLNQNTCINFKMMPNELVGAYQYNTKADLTKLRNVGYTDSFIGIEEGIDSYLRFLNKDILERMLSKQEK